jgi:thiopeptide-type bacteriocin biosynthesis protein
MADKVEMVTASEETDWVSIHLFFEGFIYSEECDRFLMDAVVPMLRECKKRRWVKGWFFIRYTEGGPHVRLRLLPRSSRARDRMQVFLGEHAAVLAATESNAIVAARFLPYVPEVERYGGTDALRWCEHFFEASSAAVLKMLSEPNASAHSARLGKALLLIAVFARRFAGSAALGLDLIEKYGAVGSRGHEKISSDLFNNALIRERRLVEPQLLEVWESLDANARLSPALDAYGQSSAELAYSLQLLCASNKVRFADRYAQTWESCCLSIGPSLLHMTCNRLGVAIPDEAFLAHLVVGALGHVRQVEASA